MNHEVTKNTKEIWATESQSHGEESLHCQTFNAELAEHAESERESTFGERLRASVDSVTLWQICSC